jgi:hypothetical protein
MPNYRRNRLRGGTFFFTVNLLDRRSDLLVARIGRLRDAVRRVRARRPFRIDGWSSFPIISIACGRCHKVMPIFQVGGARSRSNSSKACPLASRDRRS